MANPRQKRKLRSSIPKARRKPKSKKRILTNPIIAANWDKSQTLAQNYRRLGLTAKLNKSARGVVKNTSSNGEILRDEAKSNEDGLRIPRGGEEKMQVKEARIERDGTTGRILRVLDTSADTEGKRRKPNPLGDPLNDLDSASESDGSQDGIFDQHGRIQPFHSHEDSQQAKTAVVRQLEEEAQRPEKKYKHKLSEGERAFVEELVGKYGDDYGRMARDSKINYMQRSAGDLKRRVLRWREDGGVVR